MLGWLITWSVQWMNADSSSFLILEFFSLLIMFALSDWNLFFCSRWCSGISLILVSFGGLIFVRMLRSVVRDPKAVLMLYLLPVLVNFSDMPGVYGIIAIRVSLSCAV